MKKRLKEYLEWFAVGFAVTLGMCLASAAVAAIHAIVLALI